MRSENATICRPETYNSIEESFTNLIVVSSNQFQTVKQDENTLDATSKPPIEPLCLNRIKEKEV